MAESPINLNRARKSRARLKKQAQASENVVKFGLNKVEKTRLKNEQKKSEQQLSAHLRRTNPDENS